MAVYYPPLASLADVAAVLGRPLTTEEQAQGDALLAQASALFRAASRRTFTPDRKVVRLKVNGGEVRLPETPVVTVHSVVLDDDDPTVVDPSPVAYTRFNDTLNTGLRSHRFVRVDYEFGSSTVPDLVITTVAQIVARMFTVDTRAKAGMTQYQETTGPLSEGGTFAAWAVGGQMMLSPADQAVAASFRPRRLSNTVVLRP